MVSILFAIGLSMFGTGCSAGALQRAPEMVGQAGEATAISIGTLQKSIADLTRTRANPNGVIPAEAALRAQSGLLTVNTSLKPLPGVLRAIDLAQKSGDPNAALIIQALDILQAVSGELSIVVAGIPVNDSTKQILEAVVAGQRTVTTLLVQLGRLSAGVKMQASKSLSEIWHTSAFRFDDRWFDQMWIEENADRLPSSGRVVLPAAPYIQE